MKRVIIADSCLELNDELKKRMDVKLIPVNLDLGDEYIKDDENLDVKEFVRKMRAYDGVPKTAAPSPNAFYEAMKGYDEVFVVTITSKLSTIYNSAMIAKQMMNESNPEVKVHVFDSKSAVSGETLLAIEINEMIEEQSPFEVIVEKIENRVKEMRTYFVLENLDNLVKNGRMSKLAGKVAAALSINPVCRADDGSIEVVNKTRGMKAGLAKMVSNITEGLDDLSKRTLVIGHVLSPQRATELKAKFEELYKFKEIQVVPAKGVTAIYANEGGIVVAL
ncbi:MAG: DegV family protein [Tissierellia bacterium]|nr:DegV family protein [Tissierellia bacterium]